MSAAAPASTSEDPDPDPDSQVAGAPRLWSGAFVSLVAAQAIFGFAYSLFVLLPKLLAVGYGATASEIGLVMGAFGVASLAVIPAIPPIIRRLGCRRAIVHANLALVVSALAFVFIDRAGLAAAVLRGVQGVSWSLFFAAGMALVAEVAPPARLGHAIGLFGGAALAMSAVGPLVAEPLAAYAGARWVFVLSAAVAVIGAWFCGRLPESSRAPAAPRPADAHRKTDGMRARAIAVMTVGSLAAAAVFTFVAPFALLHHIAAVRGFFVSFTVAALAVRIGAARFTDRLGHRRAALASAAGYGLVVIALGLVGPGPLILLGAAFGVAHGMIFPALMALLLSGTSADERPRLLAFTNGAVNLGVTGVLVLGPIAEHAGYPAVFIATGAVTAATALSLARSPPTDRSAPST